MYKFKKDKMKIPCYVWSEKESIEQGTIDQIKNASSLPFAFHHTVLCPDAHLGYGAPIGGVLATKGYIIPNFVGVDIGCGMCAVKTSLTEINTETLKKIMGEIRNVIPVGKNKHKEFRKYEKYMPKRTEREERIEFEFNIITREWVNACKSLGTLGGGNHFIEIQKGNDGHIWIMIHSGSRNLGLQVANHYNNIAKKLNKKWHSEIDPTHDLAFLPIDNEEGKAYLREMNYCVNFALANRKLMMERVCEIFENVFNTFDMTETKIQVPDITFDNIINIAHNYAKMENHFGENVMVHRKGATLASDNTTGIIPGSQGSKSYIVKGLGNPQSFLSCSHGAGRKMGRKQAEKTLDLETEKKILNDLGVIHSIRNQQDLDEAPGAYKDINTVMENQKDLIKIQVELTPLGVIKG